MFKNYKAFCIQFWSFIAFHCCWTVFFGVYSMVDVDDQCKDSRLAGNALAIFIFHLTAGSLQLSVIPFIFGLVYLLRNKPKNFSRSLDHIYAVIIIWILLGCLVFVVLQILAYTDGKNIDCPELTTLSLCYIIITGFVSVAGLLIFILAHFNFKRKEYRDSLYQKLSS
jgi:hypothetical protein